MSITDLATAKAHLRIDHDNEDIMIQAYIDAAEKHVNDWCDRAEEWKMFPAPVASAVLLIVGDLYANREAQGPQLYRNQTVEFLLQPYREWML